MARSEIYKEIDSVYAALDWKVLVESSSEISYKNIFNLSATFQSDFKELLVQQYLFEKSFSEFEESLKRILMRTFWARCEYEIIVSSWPSREESEKKIDVFSQIEANWNIFVDYIWRHRI